MNKTPLFELDSTLKIVGDLAVNKKARNVVVLDMRKLTDIADYFFICSGRSTRHSQTIADAILEELQNLGLECNHIEGYLHGNWILMDYGSILIHIFQSEVRRTYDLEELWSEAPKITIEALEEKEPLFMESLHAL